MLGLPANTLNKVRPISFTIMQYTYLYLAVAVIGEVIATSALNASNQFTKFIPSILVILGYCAAFYFESLVLRALPVGVTYAIWAGLGIVLVTIMGIFLYQQIPDIPAIIGLSLIILGVIVIHVFSETATH